MNTIIITGQAGTGKTLNSERFKEFYGCIGIHDGWPFSTKGRVDQGFLHLTQKEDDLPPGVRVITIENALKDIGVEK